MGNFCNKNEKYTLLDKNLTKASKLSGTLRGNTRTLCENGNGVSVIWNNLTVTADIQERRIFKPTIHHYKPIIHNVTGAIEPGHLVAIIGASGSGKSTLMSVLANRSSGELITEGDIRVARMKIGNFIKDISGYVYQHDMFIPTLTVMEHLNFTAQLKLDRSVDKETRIMIIENILSELGLQDCGNKFIGHAHLGKEKMTLSGGELKRLSVATELITNPKLLFCDEPTTGLDSYSALKLMTILRNMADNKNKTIICSIHQPSEKIFLLFHQILILHKGRIAFIGTREDALTFFHREGYEYKPDQNPAEFFINSLAIIPSKEIETNDQAQNVCDHFAKSQQFSSMETLITEETNVYGDYIPHHEFRNPVSWTRRLCLITYKNLLSIYRDPSIQIILLIQQIAVGLMSGLCLVNTVTLTQEGLQSIQGVVFILVTENFFPPIYAAINRFPKELPIFYREYSSGLVSPLIFYLSSTLSTIPCALLESMTYALILYWMASLRPTFYATFMTCVICILTINISQIFGVLMSIVCRNVSIAMTYTIPIDNALMILCGIYINLRTVPWIIRWIRYINPFTYACEALFILQLEGITNIQCSDKSPMLPCLKTGQEVLKHYDYEISNFWFDISAMFTMYFVLNIFAYLFLVLRCRKKC